MVRAFVICCLLVVAMPRGAAADWHFTPMVGLTSFGDTSFPDPELGTGRTHTHLGGSVAWLSRGIFGIEGVVTWTPNFFEGERTSVAVKSSRAVSLMGNVLFTLPQRWTEYGLRPYISGGFGLMHANQLDQNEIFPVRLNARGLNIGGGAVGFLSQHTGVRFDARYHTTLNLPDEELTFGSPHLRYMTFSIGVVIRR